MINIAGFGSLSSKDIDMLEREFGVNIPNDYKTFLELYNGGIPKQNYLTFVIPDINEEIILGVLLGLNENKNYDLFSWNREYREDMIESSLIIGTEYNSGLIVLINQVEESGVYFWDNAYMFDSSSDETNTYKLSDSFSQFIDGLVLNM